MVVVNINSGLGNQMFQYAFGYSQSENFNTFCMIDKTNSVVLNKYFKLNLSARLQLSNNKYLLKIARRIIKHIKGKRYTDFTDCNLLSTQLNSTDNTYYVGYFQSIAFFENKQKEIKKQFQIKNRFVNNFQKSFGSQFVDNKTLVIHVRRTDYLKHGVGKNLGSDDLSLPMSYYKRCLSEIDNLESYRIIVIGDDMKFIQKNFSDLPNVSFEQNELIVDFQLLMNADVAIISNSTFAWWAVYLNEKANKRVYAPKYFLGFHINSVYPVEIDYKLAYHWISPL